MEPVYGVGRVVGIGKLKDLLCLSLKVTRRPGRWAPHLVLMTLSRRHAARMKKKRLLHFWSGAWKSVANPRAVDEPEREAILAIDIKAHALKRSLKTSRFKINQRFQRRKKRRRMRTRRSYPTKREVLVRGHDAGGSPH